MKQHNPAKKSSRRSFTKSVAYALTAAPFVSAYCLSPESGAEATEPAPPSDATPPTPSPVIFKDHIPPIEIFSDTVFEENADTQIKSGSVFIHTLDNFDPSSRSRSSRSVEQAGTQVFGRNIKIIGVRVVLTDGTIVVDYPKGNQDIVEGKIKIWVKKPIMEDKPDMVLSTAGANRKLQVEFRNRNHKFKLGHCNCQSRGRQKLTYGDIKTGLLKVVVSKSDNTSLAWFDTIVTPYRELEIDRIIIWTSQVDSHMP
jgi:hypothetical protein